MRGLLACALVAAVCKAGVAYAGADSLLTVGVNTAVAVRQNSSEIDGADEHSLTSSFGLQLKVLRCLGAEIGYATIGAGAREPVRFDNPWNASALIWIVPTTPVGGYLKAGVGNTGLNKIFDISSPDATYHGGAGIEVHLSKHVVLGGEFLFLVPSTHQITQGVTGSSDTPHDASYYVAVSNFRASLRASYYF